MKLKRKSPKTHRKILRRPIVLEPGISITTFDISGHGSRVENLPPYGEYNPNRVHVARRRRAHKENNAFPRGWTFEADTKPIHFIGTDILTTIADEITVANGGWTTCTKVSDDGWIVKGDIS